ncbi:HNH endonuclease [Streptomyces sp. M10(2022)]
MTANAERIFTAHWTEDAVRDILLDLVGGKCWYCETLILRADVNVDHFRPKSEVLDVPGHPGYWWLAYEVSNYRIACKHCNSGGARYNGVPEGRAKGSQFPLLAGTRARASQDDVEREQPLLLDPAHKGDPDLLGFDTAGYARRSNTPYSHAETDSGLCRADETIRILALNDSRIIKQRSFLMREVGVLARFGDAPDIQQLIDDKVGPQAPWSSAAAIALALQRACDRPPLRPPARDGARRPTGHRSGTFEGRPVRPAGASGSGRPEGWHHAHRPVQQEGARRGPEGRWVDLHRDTPWRTPTTAARAVTGSRKIVGWDFWRLTIGGVELTLAEFRAKHFPPIAPT